MRGGYGFRKGSRFVKKGEAGVVKACEAGSSGRVNANELDAVDGGEGARSSEERKEERQEAVECGVAMLSGRWKVDGRE